SRFGNILTLRVLLSCRLSSRSPFLQHCSPPCPPGSPPRSCPGAAASGRFRRGGAGRRGLRGGTGSDAAPGLRPCKYRGGAAPAAGTCPLRVASRRRGTGRRRHGLLDHLPPRGADLRHPLPRVFLLQGREDEEREGICEVDDVLDCVRLFHHCRNTHRHCSFLEIDEYITQARDKSYETMMRVGKRGLNLAANAAVTAAAKGQGVLSEKLRSFSMQDLTLIRDEDTVHLRSHEPQLHPPGATLLETIEDSASCYSSGEESSVAQRSNGTLTETRTDPSDEDAGDKLPKRTQSLKAPKKMTKAERTGFGMTIKKQKTYSSDIAT
uniref:Receptor accessory protein 2 n=1 Tax=Anser brachyrhynchus TaxID=132585 RepID=A0A8B9CKM1_9AVES